MPNKNNVVDFCYYKKKKNELQYTQVKPIKPLTPEQLKSSMEFKRRSWERDD